MPERGPLGLKRPLSMGPFAGEDAIVTVRLEGEAPSGNPPRMVEVIADAVAHETNEFIDLSGSRKWMVSQAPVTVGEEFDHYTVTLYYPDSKISKRDVRDVRNQIQTRTEKAESVNIMRV